MSQAQDKLTQLLAPTVESMGYELVGVEYLAQGKHSTLRIFIDSPDGINLDDCSRVSHQVSGVLDVEEPIHGQYNLEISSPGLDRPLFVPEHFQRFAGHQVKLRLRRPVDGRRKLVGVIDHVEGDQIYIKESDVETLHALQMSDIEKANLVPEF